MLSKFLLRQQYCMIAIVAPTLDFHQVSYPFLVFLKISPTLQLGHGSVFYCFLEFKNYITRSRKEIIESRLRVKLM